MGYARSQMGLRVYASVAIARSQLGLRVYASVANKGRALAPEWQAPGTVREWFRAQEGLPGPYGA